MLLGAGSSDPGNRRIISYIKKPVRLDTLEELISAPKQSLFLSPHYQCGFIFNKLERIAGR